MSLTADGDTHPPEDVNQPRYRSAANSEAAAILNGGEGIYIGGASVFGDITTGTVYPALLAAVADDAGGYWWVRKATGTTMTFLVTSGACTAYLVVGQVAGVSPVMATGGATDFTIVVQLTATAAPAHSLPLGSGAVTASAFTDWTVDPAVMVAANASPFARRDLAETISGAWTFSGTAPTVSALTASQPVVTDGAKKLTSAGFATTDIARLSGAVFTGAVDIEGALTIQDAGNDHDATIAVADLAAARAYTIPDFGADGKFTLRGDWTSYGGTSTIVGWELVSPAMTNNDIYYLKLGPLVMVAFRLLGTSDGTTATFTLPFTAATGGIVFWAGGVIVTDNSVTESYQGAVNITGSGTIATLRKTSGSGVWTGSGTKGAYGQFMYVTG